MIDTIVLTLSKGTYHIKEPDKFEPSASWALDETKRLGSRGYITSKQNPIKAELLKGVYKPRLTLTSRFNHTGRREATLKIEFSVPKLLFNNNFDELTNSDFDKVIEVLQARLKDMGIGLFKGTLVNSPVSAIHYSKNIPLTNGLTPHYLISKIKEANISLALDINQTDYRNDGHSYKWHANSYEVAFYDKVRDLECAKKKGEKRAIEKDNSIQLGLFDSINERMQLEVLRMEIRLNSRQKMKQLFTKLGIEKELTFYGLFDSCVSQKVLTYYLTEMENRRPALLDHDVKSVKDLIALLVINNTKLGPLRTLQIVGLKLAFDEVTPRELRTMFGKYGKRSWYRLMSEVSKVKLPKLQSPFAVIKKHLDIFAPLKLVDFQDVLLNNDKYK